MEINVQNIQYAQYSAAVQAASQTEKEPEETDTSPDPSVSDKDEKDPVYDIASFDPEEDEDYKTIKEMLEEARKTTDAYQKFLKDAKSRRTSNCGDTAIQAYARLARARTATEVDAATGYARRQIAYLKGLLSADDDNAPKVRAAINQLQKAVNRGAKKKSDLNREKRLAQQKAKSKAAAERQKQELRRRKTQRALRESAYMQEAHTANRLASQLTATRMELRQQAQDLAKAAQTSLDTALQQYTGTVEAAAAPAASAPEVSVEA
ncbi:MAG: hypothetical protein K2O18_03640 [Oscillospiraceae bacterium]|nr:hypothetical protein [Oscillospiraceae bacterium]